MLFQTRSLSLLPKIMELEQALFFNFSPAVLKLSASLINVLHVDQIGQAWFLIRKPLQRITEFDREFEARLELYKKGKEFHMRVSGRACLVIDPEEVNTACELNPALISHISPDMVLVKLIVSEINYYPHRQKATAAKPNIPFVQPSAFFKTLQYIIKDVIPVFQSH